MQLSKFGDEPRSGGQHQHKVVFTEMEEFVSGLQLEEEEQKPDCEDVFKEDDATKNSTGREKETMREEIRGNKEEENVVPDDTIHESAVGKGLAATLKLLKDRGAFRETIEWGGRNADKKKSKLISVCDNDGAKEVNIERTDEYGLNSLTPKEQYRQFSHRFHGKGPGKAKKEKRMRQYQVELKAKRMKNTDTPSLSMERIKEAQAKLQTLYLVLSGHVKPWSNTTLNIKCKSRGNTASSKRLEI